MRDSAKRVVEISQDAIGRSSQPVRDTSSGTRSPSSTAVFKAPIATRSLKQTTTDGRGEPSPALTERSHAQASQAAERRQ